MAATLGHIPRAASFKTQSAAPADAGRHVHPVLFTTAYAPLALLTGWLHTVAKYNPVTQVVEAARQGFIGAVTWANTWPGLLALPRALVALFPRWRLRGMRRIRAY